MKQENTQDNGMPRQQKTAVILFSIIAVLFLAAVVTGIVYLSGKDAETTGRVRDIFIIVLALESLLIGAALVILVIQLAVLTNLIQNEVKPILTSAKETASTLTRNQPIHFKAGSRTDYLGHQRAGRIQKIE